MSPEKAPKAGQELMILLLCSQGGTGPGGVQAATQVPGRQATRPGGPQDQAEPVPSTGCHELGSVATS